MKALVTGGAGFIGSTLVDRLLAEGHAVTVFDNFSTGRHEFLADARRSPGFSLIEGDLLDTASLDAAVEGRDVVFHLAANADVRFGPDHPRRDLEQNTLATFNVLDAMRRHGVAQIVFSSTGSIYGEPTVFPTPEDAPFPVQTSLYGASKLACEGLIQAYVAAFGMRAWIFRFVSILGERYSHGHVVDFYRSLRRDGSRLHVLGNGLQRKSYLCVQDCIDGILLAMERARAEVNIFNLGTDDTCQVNDSIGWIAERLGLSPELSYAGEERGWIGDSPLIHLDCSRMRALGWAPRLSIRDGVIRTLDYLVANHPWLDGD
ncbi:MAG: NAD-dependent epimerase/dehydratase family protein [Vicinamibacterales bacterium]